MSQTSVDDDDKSEKFEKYFLVVVVGCGVLGIYAARM
jgi:hypothetical protein